LPVVTILAGGIRTLCCLLIALKSHRDLARFVISAAEKIVGQQTVIRGTMVFEEQDVGFYILNSEGLVVLVAQTDAVKPAPHTAAVGFSSTAA
jgi:hypothetical protein